MQKAVRAVIRLAGFAGNDEYVSCRETAGPRPIYN